MLCVDEHYIGYTNCQAPKQMLTSKLVNRTGISIKKMIHGMYEKFENRISLAPSLSPPGDLRKMVSKLKFPAVMDITFTIAVAGGEKGDRYRKEKQYKLHSFHTGVMQRDVKAMMNEGA